MTTAAPTRPPLGTTYFRGVDGLRGIAVLSVLVFHTGLFETGLFGVDLFFVLSGFLITLTLLREFHAGGTIRIGRFYARRAKRLLPLLFAVLGLTLAAVLAFGSTAELQRFAQQAGFSLLYLTNWEQIAAGQDYWAGLGHLNPLGHLWSLAITEQFYLLWPPLVLGVLALGRLLSRRSDGGADSAVATRSPRRVLVLLALGVTLFAVAALQPALRYDGSNADRLYLGTDTHVAGLVAGAVAAIVRYLWLERRARRGAASRSTGRRSAAPRAGRTHPVIAATRVAGITTTSVAALTAIVLLSLQAGDYTDAWLYRWGFAVVAALGAILALTLTSRHNLLTRPLSLAPVVALGKVSYIVFLIHLPLYWLITAIEPASGPVDLALLGIPGSLLIGGGLHHLVAEPVRLRRWGRKGLAAFVTAGVVVTSAVVAGPALAIGASKGAGNVHVLTIGDSLANDFAQGLAATARDRFTVTDAGLPGCGISGGTAQRTAAGIEQDAPAGCNPWQARWTDAIERARPDAVVVDLAWDAVSQRIGGAWTDPTQPGFAAAYRAQLEKLAAITDRAGTRVFVANTRLHSAVVTPAQASAFNAVVEGFAAAHPSITLLDLQGRFCTADACSPKTADGSARYRDDRVHFSTAGQAELGRWLGDRIAAGL